MSSHRSALLTTALVAACLGAVPLAAPAFAQDRGIAALLDQATYWKLQSRPDQVVRTLERVLAVDPRNAEALAGIAEAQAQLGNAQAAQQALGTLRQAAPADPRTEAADVAVRTQTVDSGALAQARQLAQAGRNAEAVQRYRAVFRGATPPDSFALEYYQTLAGTEGGWAEAREGLSRLVQRAPANASAQLALAQILTYREETRAEGIEALRRLSGQPAAQQSATAAWRQALTWIGTGPEAAGQLESYLRQNPNDAEIARRLEEARSPQAVTIVIPPGTDERMAGWEALQANRLREAERAFEAALAAAPNSAESLGGLGIVRLRQGRMQEARRLLEGAIAADPSTRPNWQAALDGIARAGRGGGRNAGAGGGAGPAMTADIQRARQLVSGGQDAEAVPVLQRIVQRNGADRPDAEALLGDIALRAGNAAEAETRFRAALQRRGNFGAAISGLANALQAQGRFDEAEAQFRRLGGDTAPQVRAEALRAEAQRTTDPAAAAALLQAALQTEPENPWLRLDLARLLAANGRGADARGLMDQMVANRATPEQIHAAALFAGEQSRYADAVALLNRLPARARNADMNRYLALVRLRGEVQSAAALAQQGRRAEARQRLVAIASRPDPTGEAAPSAVRALNAINDAPGAQQAARMAAIASRGQPAAARLAAAGALLEAGLAEEAAQAAAAVETERLNAEQRRQARALQAGVAIRTADRLNERGDQATAFDVLVPALREDPANPAANLALARLYRGARDPEQAGRIAEAVLSRNPRDTDARQAAMDAAIARRDWGRAEALLAEGRALLPNDARIPMLESRLARAWGDQRRARAALEAAAQLRRQQLGADATTPGLMTSNGAAAAPQAQGVENPFRRVPLAGDGRPVQLAQAFPVQARPVQAVPVQAVPADPLLSEITRQLSEVREEAAPRVTPGFGFRMRSGTEGIDRMTEVHGGAEGSIAMPGIGGRVLARVSAVSLDGGEIARTVPTLRQFGGNPLTLPGASGQASTALLNAASRYDTSASGVALGAAYTRDGFSIDIGTTPLGFERQNVVGGLEVAPEIGDGVRLRLIAERRAVTDSILAWGGLQDPAFNRTWGGVTRTGGRAQLEFSAGESNLYIAAGYYAFDGDGVATNARIEAGAGIQIPLFRGTTDELITGLDLVYFGYDRNLRFFTLGHGGYFSPQSFMAANVPIDYRARSGNLFYRFGASIGIATFSEDRTAVFPNDPGLQGALQARAAAESDVTAFYAGQSSTTLTGGLRADAEYQISQQLRIGGSLRYDRAADWDEGRALLYARYRFDR